jgi:phosphoglycolate phosphatase-like HAD superfamily hydrolase/uridine kinase
MINPNDVGLIIFDMDGTIVPSLPAVYEAIKRAFHKLGWAVNFSAEDINRFFGMPSTLGGGGLYEFITPPDSQLTHPEIRDKVRHEEAETFREMAQPYPGTRETLETLRKRGYKLAQYTNASTYYLDMVMSSLNTAKYFDYVECVHHNNLNKVELVKKIRERFGGITAAVVGDRWHDIEAARETDSLAIGALYGYGGGEPEQADITIKSFRELLRIFDRRLPIFEKILGEIERKKDKERPFVIGVNGIDGSGKTEFAEALEKFLINRNYLTQAIHLDDFHNPKAIRYAGRDQADNYYNKSFNINLIVENLLKPLRQKETSSVHMTLLDWPTDKQDAEREFSFNPETIVIFEGVFLFRKELAKYIDYKVFLDITFEESKKRAKGRDPKTVIKKYDEKYLPAQAKYLKEYPPEKMADMIIDNNDWEYPRIKYTRITT